MDGQASQYRRLKHISPQRFGAWRPQNNPRSFKADTADLGKTMSHWRVASDRQLTLYGYRQNLLAADENLTARHRHAVLFVRFAALGSIRGRKEDPSAGSFVCCGAHSVCAHL